jgi:hypothetical protein
LVDYHFYLFHLDAESKDKLITIDDAFTWTFDVSLADYDTRSFCVELEFLDLKTSNPNVCAHISALSLVTSSIYFQIILLSSFQNKLVQFNYIYNKKKENYIYIID